MEIKGIYHCKYKIFNYNVLEKYLLQNFYKMKLINKICSFFTIPFVFSYMSSNDTNLSIKTEANYMKSFEDNQNHEEPMNLCFATDDKYAVHTATAIASRTTLRGFLFVIRAIISSACLTILIARHFFPLFLP